MIDTDFNWTEPLNILLLVAAVALLALQCWLLFARHRNAGRFGTRLVFNGLLWVSLLTWLFDPYFQSNAGSKTGLLIAGNVPSGVAGRLRDSLAGAELLRADEIAGRPVDTLVIVGQEFDEKVFASIRQLKNMPVLHWKPWFAADALRNLQWKGVLRKGEMQRIEGGIRLSEKKTLQVRYAGRTLDSVMLNAGENRFRLAFPTFSEGRTTATIDLDGRTIDTLRFFGQPGQKLTVSFLLDNPDFETRNLATWLGKQGHSVLYASSLSKNIRSKLNINRAAEPDLVVTSASNAADAAVKKAVNAGKSVLFLQLDDPVTDLRAINNALGTRFQSVKISNEESVTVSNSLTALPFRFEASSFQLQAPHYPVVTEKTTGKIAVSLLNETFPMQLSGDSIAYGKVWNEILAYARPAQAPVIEWDAPVYQNVPVTVHLNNFQPVPRFLTVGEDTVSTIVSALNDRSAAATFLPENNGWLGLHDSLQTELYVQDYSPLRHASRMQHFILSTQELDATTGLKDDAVSTRRLPGWAWFTWLMLCLAALWIEPKL
ncbi:hypothetical protein J2Y45_005848 [Dyadobacter sp. BE34]|uniref:Aerotolerance regulator N-terminal domain-containing protein n=1 Tax=Dyadobacter fermentans TaxID=94254 RepID=A0ABU1R5G0_9BACT|nr:MULTISPECIES: hypothetical protein [Dyadobacter]MDR6808636.1 hypothetical protein [Dyadobacter fermentans]MDR7046379.1 hypothetical protein [Dyadobacter sp. BE242]MDR7200692.1 hypothetical protein [Dyadobacter sp. BE34]MDR7218652.1 hypothetical protein [Dyadobacter sp. BE31]MDR7266582.1 hypothetical protein [Dyadobacter sp. BE32]